MVGGLKYIENIQNLVRCYYFEENCSKIFTQRREISLAEIEESKNFSNLFWPTGKVYHTTGVVSDGSTLERVEVLS